MTIPFPRLLPLSLSLALVILGFACKRSSRLGRRRIHEQG